MGDFGRREVSEAGRRLESFSEREHREAMEKVREDTTPRVVCLDADDQKVNHPPHYNAGPVETIDVIGSMGLEEPFCVATAVKYLSRYRANAGSKDLLKAEWYVRRVARLLRKEEAGEEIAQGAMLNLGINILSEELPELRQDLIALVAARSAKTSGGV